MLLPKRGKKVGKNRVVPDGSLRDALGCDDVVDRTANACRYGGYAGQAFNIALTVATPTGWAAVAVGRRNGPGVLCPLVS